MSFQRRLATLPWPFTVLGVTAAALAGAALGRYVFVDPENSTLWPAAWVVAGVAGVIAGVAVVLRNRRLLAQGRFEAVLAAGEAMQTGRVPADPAIRAEMATMLSQQRPLLPLFRWVGPLLFGTVAVANVPAALDDRPRAWIGAAVFAALACFYPLYAHRVKARLDAVDAQLRQGP